MKRTILKTLLPFALMASSSTMLLAADGDLDTSFGGDGKVITNNSSGSYDYANAVAIQNDGKILAVGSIYNGDNKDDFLLLRYNPDGSLDTAFGSSGKVSTNFTGAGYRDKPSCITIQNDGKIVMAGRSANEYGPGDFALARYNSDGSLDTTFDVDGKVVTNLGSNDGISSIIIMDSGKILVGGASNQNFALVRYDSNGSIDTTFGSSGKVITDFGGQDGVNSIVVQNDGKIIAAGTTDYGLYSYDFALARYQNDGSLDTTFDTDGKVTTDFGTNGDIIRGVTIQGDGKIIAVGEIRDTSGEDDDYDFALARYNNDGSLDVTFDSDGKVTTSFGGNNDQAYSVVIQKSGKIVVAGYGGNSDFALARYIPEDGSLDTTFGSDGKVMTDFRGGVDAARSVAIQGDGNIVAAGVSYPPDSYFPDFALARYESAPCLEGYQLKQGENICIPGTPEPDADPYPTLPSNDFVQGDVNEDGSRVADPGHQGDYPTLCRDETSNQGDYDCP